jgi:hypothetical protein
MKEKPKLLKGLLTTSHEQADYLDSVQVSDTTGADSIPDAG